MVAPLSKLSFFSLKHMLGPGEFFMSPKEKGPKLPWEAICPSRKQNLWCLGEHQCPLERKGLKVTKE